MVVVWLVSHVLLFVTPWTVACQAPLSMWFPRQEYWSELLFPSPGDLPNSGIETCISCAGRWILYHWTIRKTHQWIINRSFKFQSKGSQSLCPHHRMMYILSQNTCLCHWCCIPQELCGDLPCTFFMEVSVSSSETFPAAWRTVVAGSWPAGCSRCHAPGDPHLLTPRPDLQICQDPAVWLFGWRCQLSHELERIEIAHFTASPQNTVCVEPLK